MTRTALSAIAVAAQGARSDLFLEVAVRGSIRASIGAKLGTTSQAEMTRLWLEGREVP